LDLGTAIHSCK